MLEVEGLGHTRPRPQSRADFGCFSIARQDHQRHTPPARLVPQGAHEARPIHIGHREVEQEQRGPVAGKRRQGLSPGADRLHLVAVLLQGIPDHAPHRRIVVGDQNACHTRAGAQGACHRGCAAGRA